MHREVAFSVGRFVTPVQSMSRHCCPVRSSVTARPVVVKEPASKCTLVNTLGRQVLPTLEPPLVLAQWLGSCQLPLLPTQYRSARGRFAIVMPALPPRLALVVATAAPLAGLPLLPSVKVRSCNTA